MKAVCVKISVEPKITVAKGAWLKMVVMARLVEKTIMSVSKSPKVTQVNVIL